MTDAEIATKCNRAGSGSFIRAQAKRRQILWMVAGAALFLAYLFRSL